MSPGASKLPQPNKEVLEMCILGNRNAFKELVEITQEYVFNIAYKILLDEHDAKDAVQESYIKIWNNIKSFNHNYLFSTWMYRIVVNTCLDKIKSIKRQKRVQGDEQTENYVNTDPLVNKDLVKHIRRVSQQLPYKQRIVFILVDLQNLDIEETSSIMNIDKGAVKSNLYYARKGIREKLLKLDNWRD